VVQLQWENVYRKGQADPDKWNSTVLKTTFHIQMWHCLLVP